MSSPLMKHLGYKQMSLKTNKISLDGIACELRSRPCKKLEKKTKTKSLGYSEVELLREVLLGLLQPVQSVLSLQVNLRVLKMVPNDSSYPKTWGLKKTRSLACLEVELLHEELHHLLRPSTTILDTLTMCSYCCTMCSEFVYT